MKLVVVVPALVLSLAAACSANPEPKGANVSTPPTASGLTSSSRTGTPGSPPSSVGESNVVPLPGSINATTASTPTSAGVASDPSANSATPSGDSPISPPVGDDLGAEWNAVLAACTVRLACENLNLPDANASPALDATEQTYCEGGVVRAVTALGLDIATAFEREGSVALDTTQPAGQLEPAGSDVICIFSSGSDSSFSVAVAPSPPAHVFESQFPKTRLTNGCMQSTAVGGGFNVFCATANGWALNLGVSLSPVPRPGVIVAVTSALIAGLRTAPRTTS